MSPTFILAAILFAGVFLASGVWFLVFTENVASLDMKLTARLPRGSSQRKPRIGGGIYKIMFKAVGAVFIAIGAALSIMVVMVLRGAH